MKSKSLALKINTICFICIFSGVLSENSVASTMYLLAFPPQIIGIIGPPPTKICPIGEPTCDQEWTTWSLPKLEKDQSLSLNAASSYFSYHLGNILDGEIKVSLTPFFRTDREGNIYSPPNDEIKAWIGDRESLITKTDFGMALFSAGKSMDYYLFLAGTMRIDQEYQLQISQVPLPSAGLLMASSIGFLIRKSRSKKLN